MSQSYREHLRAASNGELDAIALSLFTLRCQVKLNRAQTNEMVCIWYEFCDRDRVDDYRRLQIEAQTAWKEGREPNVNCVPPAG